MSSVIESTAVTPAAVAEDVVILLSKAAAAALRTANLALEPYGLRARHYAALRMAATPAGVAQRQLGLLLGLDPSAVVGLVDDLEKLRLVQRHADPDDRRTRVVVATVAGQRLLEGAPDIPEQVQSEVLAGVAPQERERFVALLAQLVGSHGL